MGVDLVVSVAGTVDQKKRELINRFIMQPDRFSEGWEPYWGEELKEDRTYTYCFPGDRYIGIDSVVGQMNLQELPRLATIWSAFYLVLNNSRRIYFLADYNTPTQFDEPVSPAYMRKLAKRRDISALRGAFQPISHNAD